MLSKRCTCQCTCSCAKGCPRRLLNNTEGKLVTIRITGTRCETVRRINLHTGSRRTTDGRCWVIHLNAKRWQAHFRFAIRNRDNNPTVKIRFGTGRCTRQCTCCCAKGCPRRFLSNTEGKLVAIRIIGTRCETVRRINLHTGSRRTTDGRCWVIHLNTKCWQATFELAIGHRNHNTAISRCLHTSGCTRQCTCRGIKRCPYWLPDDTES